MQPEAEQQAAQQAAAAYDDDFGGDGAPMAGGWDDDDAPPAPHAADGTPARQAQHLGGGAPFMAIDQEEEEDGEPDPWAPLDFDDPNGASINGAIIPIRSLTPHGLTRRPPSSTFPQGQDPAP